MYDHCALMSIEDEILHLNNDGAVGQPLVWWLDGNSFLSLFSLNTTQLLDQLDWHMLLCFLLQFYSAVDVCVCNL